MTVTLQGQSVSKKVMTGEAIVNFTLAGVSVSKLTTSLCTLTTCPVPADQPITLVIPAKLSVASPTGPYVANVILQNSTYSTIACVNIQFAVSSPTLLEHSRSE